MPDYPSFSQRIGIEPISKIIQLNDMDISLRNGIWNFLTKHYFEEFTTRISKNLYQSSTDPFFSAIWDSFLKLRVDELLDSNNRSCVKLLGKYFDKMDWNKVYDFIEFLLKHRYSNEELVADCNAILERESSGYRLVNSQIISITNPNELNEISQATQTDFDEINSHFKTSLFCLFNRNNPDPRNSIKESISAVESICKKIINKPETTLGKALEEIEKNKSPKLHPSMKEAFHKLYEYTNDASGIRHALMNGKTSATIDDAKFMLVSCTAFVNYMISKYYVNK